VQLGGARPGGDVTSSRHRRRAVAEQQDGGGLHAHRPSKRHAIGSTSSGARRLAGSASRFDGVLTGAMVVSDSAAARSGKAVADPDTRPSPTCGRPALLGCADGPRGALPGVRRRARARLPSAHRQEARLAAAPRDPQVPRGRHLRQDARATSTRTRRRSARPSTSPPTGIRRDPDERYCTLRHEAVHLRQFRRFTLPGWRCSTCFLPLPLGLAWFRATSRRRPTPRASGPPPRSTGATIPRGTLVPRPDHRAVHQPSYGWMWPFRRAMERWYDGVLATVDAER
jgi:hypothetical protein